MVLLSHLKCDTGSQTVICLIRPFCVWINFLELVARMWLSARLSFLAEEAREKTKQPGNNLVSQTAPNNRDLTGEVIRGGRHAAPPEERLGFGVHHQQTGHVPTNFDGRHNL